MDKIFLKGLSARGIIGVHEWERESPQEILINLVLYGDVKIAGESDNLEDSINYQTVAEDVLSLAEKVGRLTVEALATDIARLCLRVKGVEKVKVRVEKPEAIPYTRSVGVEIVRDRDDFQ